MGVTRLRPPQPPLFALWKARVTARGPLPPVRNKTTLPLQVSLSIYRAGTEAGRAGDRQLRGRGHHHGGGLHSVSKGDTADPEGLTVEGA